MDRNIAHLQIYTCVSVHIRNDELGNILESKDVRESVWIQFSVMMQIEFK